MLAIVLRQMCPPSWKLFARPKLPLPIRTPIMDSNLQTWNLLVLVKGSVLFSTQDCVAPRHGFEPRFTAPKAAVLPLDDRGKAQAGLFLVILTRPGRIPIAPP